MPYPRIDPRKIAVLPLAQRRSFIDVRTESIDPDSPPPPVADPLRGQIDRLAAVIRAARARGASVMLTYGAHLVKNCCGLLVNRLIERGHVTHLATQGAGIIHDWEFAFQGLSSESVRDNAPVGRFGTWDETGRALLTAAVEGAEADLGLGEAVGRYIDQSRHLPHPHARYSIPACAYRHGVPFTVHPGVGYDIFAAHPMFDARSGAAIGRGAALDFHVFCHSVNNLTGGVYLTVGCAIMSPQVFEKAFSVANNLRHAEGKPFIKDHAVAVVDIQDNGGWDWSRGDPPKDSPAYYLRWCKTFARLTDGIGRLDYLQADNRLVLHHLVHALG
jgi:hypothetical protein